MDKVRENARRAAMCGIPVDRPAIRVAPERVVMGWLAGRAVVLSKAAAGRWLGGVAGYVSRGGRRCGVAARTPMRGRRRLAAFALVPMGVGGAAGLLGTRSRLIAALAASLEAAEVMTWA